MWIEQRYILFNNWRQYIPPASIQGTVTGENLCAAVVEDFQPWFLKKVDEVRNCIAKTPRIAYVRKSAFHFPHEGWISNLAFKFDDSRYIILVHLDLHLSQLVLVDPQSSSKAIVSSINIIRVWLSNNVSELPKIIKLRSTLREHTHFLKPSAWV